MSSEASVDLQSVVVRARDVVYSEVDGEITMMNVETGKYYGLVSPVAASIWKSLEQPLAVENICRALEGEYRVERARCEEEVLKFVQLLTAEGVVTTM